MNTKTFSIKEAIGYGFNTAMQCKEVLTVAGVYLLLQIVLPFLAPITSYAYKRFFLKLHAGVTLSIESIMALTLRGVLMYFIGTILYGVGFIIGLILLIIPGIIFYAKYYFYDLIIIDQDMSIGDAFHMSSALTKGIKLKIFVFGIILHLLQILIGLTIIGLFFIIPVTELARIYVYRKLQAQQ